MSNENTEKLLSMYIREELEKPFEWGKTDCASTADNWVKKWKNYSPLLKAGIKEINKKMLLSQSLNDWLTEVAIFNKWIKTTTLNVRIGDVGLMVRKNQLSIAINKGQFWFSRLESEHANGIVMCNRSPVIEIWRVI